MYDEEFWTFMLLGGYDLLFPDDDENSFECLFCNVVIQGDEKVEWIDKKEKTFKCPACGEKLKLG